jgi:hypothetical protein
MHHTLYDQVTENSPTVTFYPYSDDIENKIPMAVTFVGADHAFQISKFNLKLVNSFFKKFPA